MKAFFVRVGAWIRKVFGKLAEFLENENGGMSSRRLGGIALIVVSIILAFRAVDNAVVLAFLGTGTALLGLTTADKKLP